MEAGQFRERILGEVTTTLAMYGLYFGKEMGWLKSVAENPRTTARDLADRTRTVERFERFFAIEHSAETCSKKKYIEHPT